MRGLIGEILSVAAELLAFLLWLAAGMTFFVLSAAVTLELISR